MKRIVLYPCDNEGIHKCAYEEWDGERMLERLVEWNGRAIIAFTDVKRNAIMQGWWIESDREKQHSNNFNEWLETVKPLK